MDRELWPRVLDSGPFFHFSLARCFNTHKKYRIFSWLKNSNLNIHLKFQNWLDEVRRIFRRKKEAGEHCHPVMATF